MVSKTSLSALALFAAATALHARGSVWVVDGSGGPGVDFTAIQPAVEAASAGDVIVVRGGDYAEFTLAGKGLSILEDEGATVRVLGTTGSITTLVSGIPAGERAVLRGLTFVPPQEVTGNLVRVENSAGVVWLEDVELEAPVPFPFSYTLNQAEALKVVDSDQVVLSRTIVRGSVGAPLGFGLEAGSIGLTTENSTAHLYQCTVIAGGTLVLGGPGQPGMRVEGGTAVLRDSLLQGAAGGSAGFFTGPGPGNGGPALRVSGGATVWSIETQLLGGPGGDDQFGGGMGNPGPPYVSLGGTVHEFAADSALLTASVLVRDEAADDDAKFQVDTVPGSSVFLLALFGTDPVFLPTLPEATAVGLSPIVVPAGTADAQGLLSLSIGIPTLPPGLATWDATVQMAIFTPTPTLAISNPTVVTVVDEVY